MKWCVLDDREATLPVVRQALRWPSESFIAPGFKVNLQLRSHSGCIRAPQCFMAGLRVHGLYACAWLVMSSGGCVILCWSNTCNCLLLIMYMTFSWEETHCCVLGQDKILCCPQRNFIFILFFYLVKSIINRHSWKYKSFMLWIYTPNFLNHEKFTNYVNHYYKLCQFALTLFI